jgi:phage FluMu protein Com
MKTKKHKRCAYCNKLILADDELLNLRRLYEKKVTKRGITQIVISGKEITVHKECDKKRRALWSASENE